MDPTKEQIKPVKQRAKKAQAPKAEDQPLIQPAPQPVVI